GPLAYQLAVYCGYIRRGVAGGLAVAVAFALAPFLLVLAVAALYQRFAATWQLRALFYGIAPAVVALIVRACWNLGRKTLRTDVRAWLFFTIACAVTVVVEREIAWMFIIAGLLGALVFGERAAEGAGALAATLGIFTPPVLFVLCATPILLRYRNNARLRGFVRGVGTAVVGVLVGTTWLIARVAIGDALTVAVALLSVAALARWR